MSIRQSWKIKISQNLFLCALETTMWFFFYSFWEKKIPAAKDDVENLSIKNNILSNPKGKLIFTLKGFTSTNTTIMSNLALLGKCLLSPAASPGTPGSQLPPPLSLPSLWCSVGRLARTFLKAIRSNLLCYYTPTSPIVNCSELASFSSKWNCRSYYKIITVVMPDITMGVHRMFKLAVPCFTALQGQQMWWNSIRSQVPRDQSPRPWVCWNFQGLPRDNEIDQ